MMLDCKALLLGQCPSGLGSSGAGAAVGTESSVGAAARCGGRVPSHGYCGHFTGREHRGRLCEGEGPGVLSGRAFCWALFLIFRVSFFLLYI